MILFSLWKGLNYCSACSALVWECIRNNGCASLAFWYDSVRTSGFYYTRGMVTAMNSFVCAGGVLVCNLCCNQLYVVIKKSFEKAALLPCKANVV